LRGIAGVALCIVVTSNHNSANAAIGSLPSLVLQRALPGVYDMFQEYKLDAETEILVL
jgi:hypothetical protein